MEVQDDEFDKLTQNTVEIIYEIESLNKVTSRLRSDHSALAIVAAPRESTGMRARGVGSRGREVGGGRAAVEARAGTAAASAAADRALAEHTALTADLVAAKMQLGINRPGGYADLEGRMRSAVEEAQAEQSHLQDEFRSIEDSCVGGVELRGRARRAAAAHARERRLADSENRQVTEELLKANAEIAHLKAALAREQQHCQDLNKEDSITRALGDEKGLVLELRAEVVTEKAESQRLERALSAVLADSAALAARLAAVDGRGASGPGDCASHLAVATNVTAVDSFLNEL
ncbi:hypothetical protein EVAR_90079_1 [Eumeta japonica]|uniref:Uncharacterized protein n=1 Tax=Eumeta variegata TaxID=151549 RepID=A0A4C1WY72_EUMVA|nr:hypothetical protein EVAR_90079_1 [Eumeta japonica]